MSRRLLRGAGTLTVTAILALSGTAAAQQRDKQKDKPRQVPDTGVETPLPPTPADIVGEAALERMISRSSEGLVEVEHPDGTVSMDLQGRFMSVMLLRTDASGTPVLSCVTGDGTLEHAGHAHTATSAATKGAATSQRSATPAPKTSLVRELK